MTVGRLWELVAAKQALSVTQKKDNCPLNQVVIYYVNEQQKQCLSVTKMITIIKDMVLERHVHTLQNQKTVRYFNITSNIILTHLRQK